MAAEHRLISAEEWFSGGERLPYDPERASFDDTSLLRVFASSSAGTISSICSAFTAATTVRHASGGGTTLTFLPGWPDDELEQAAALAHRRH